MVTTLTHSSPIRPSSSSIARALRVVSSSANFGSVVALRDSLDYLLIFGARQQQLSRKQRKSLGFSTIRTFSAAPAVDDPITTRRNIIVDHNNGHQRLATAFSMARDESGSKSLHLQHDAVATPPPTSQQLNAHFMRSAVPMIGFGFMDQTIMLQAGHAIDCTLGVTLGLSTLSAAAFGQIVSNAGSVLFGGGLESVLTSKLKLIRNPNFSLEQSKLPIVKRYSVLGNLFGVVVGCTLGLVNLLFMDIHQTKQLKLQRALDEHSLPYKVEISNSRRDDATTIRIRGEDRTGLIASVATALSNEGLSLLEVIARTKPSSNKSSGSSLPIIEDIFVVQRVNTEDDDEHDGLLNAKSITADMDDENSSLQVDESDLPRLAEMVLQAASTKQRHKNIMKEQDQTTNQMLLTS